MAKRMSKGLVALSSAAIVSVYGAGYALTQPAAVSMAAGQTNTGTPATPAATAVSGSNDRARIPSPTAISTTAPAASPTSSGASAGLKDGTYSGTGWSRHGSVSVKLTIQGGRITAAPISGVTTRYSQSVIASLPAQVVTKQSAQVNLVSGATDSTMAYQGAVAQALAQAGGAPATSTTGSNTSAGSVQVTGPNGVIYSNGGGRQRRGGFSGD